jgi:Helicase associated domain
MPIPRDDSHFSQCFRSLVRYREDRGHFDVPSSYVDSKGRKVGAWLYRVRKACEEGRLPQDRVDLFREIGYSFEEHRIVKTPLKKPPPPRSATAAASSSSKGKKGSGGGGSTHRPKVDTWDKNFDRLVRFKEDYGHLVPDYNTHKALRMWVNKQQERWYYGELDEGRADRLRELGVPEPESDDATGSEGYDQDHDQDGANNDEASSGDAAAGAAAAADDDDLAASLEPGIATRSAKKKRKVELGEFLASSSSTDAPARSAKRQATAEAAAAAAAGEPERQPSFLACVYQAVSEKVASLFFSQHAAAPATTN